MPTTPITKEQMNSLIDQQISTKTIRRSISPSLLGGLLKTIVDFLSFLRNATPIKFTTDSITAADKGRLFTLDAAGKAVLTQKTAASPVPAVLRISCTSNQFLTTPVTPKFLLTINEQFDDGDYIKLPHIAEVFSSIVFTAKTTKSAANEFTIGATLAESRDALMSCINDLWNIPASQAVSVLPIDGDKIEIEILSSSTLPLVNDNDGKFVMPEDFNGIAANIISSGISVTFIQVQAAANGILSDAISGTYPSYRYNPDKYIKIIPSAESNDGVGMLLSHIIDVNAPFGLMAYGFRIPQSGNEVLENIRYYLSGAGGNEGLSNFFAISEINSAEGSIVYITLTLTDFTALVSPIHDFVSTIPGYYTSIEQNFIPATIPFVISQVMGMVEDVVDGYVIPSTSYITEGILKEGSNTLPAPELGDFARYKMLLFPSDNGTLENVINWGDALETPSAAIAAAMMLNGSYVALESKESGKVIVKPYLMSN